MDTILTTERNRILIYRLGSLGDLTIALPCLHLVARTYADYVRILLTNVPAHEKAPSAQAVLGESGLVHNYLTYPVGTRSILGLIRLCWKIRQLKVESLIYLAAPRGEAALRRDEMFFRLCGVRKVIGVPHGALASHRYNVTADRYEPEASRLARCIAQIGDARLSDAASWDLLLTANEQACATKVLQPLNKVPFLTLGIGCKKQVTDWGIDNWKALMPQLHSKFPRHAVVFIGAKEDRAPADSVGSAWAGPFLNLSGDLSPRESAAVIQHGDLFIGVDSGPMHLAASVGTPCVAIFAAHKLPGMWFPFGEAHEIIYHKTRCFGCDLEVCSVEKKKCILSISAEEVVAAAVRAKGLKRAVQRHVFEVLGS